MKINQVLLLIMLSSALTAQAESSPFHAGTIIKNYGQIATVDGMQALPESVSFKVSFDVYKQAEAGQLNRSIESVARFINMHAEHEVSIEQMQLAVVVHGGAVKDMVSDPNSNNNNLIKALLAQGVTFTVCGQSAAYYQVTLEQLIPGVNLALSAMTAHALLQQSGYTINPF